MLRKFLIWVLLAPLPLNGLWMACQDAPSPSSNHAEPATSAEQDDADCSKICARPEHDGSICLISAGDKSSINIIIFGLAVPAAAVRFAPPDSTAIAANWQADSYLNPSIASPSPPPRA